MKSAITEMDARRFVVNVIRMIRPDYWPKNLFVLIGSALAVFYLEETAHIPLAISHVGAMACAAVCVAVLTASANYIINELCDAATDVYHPSKKLRPIASGEVSRTLALCLWTVFAVAGLGTSALINKMVVLTTGAFLVSGLLYNVRPVRLKDVPYIDIVSESFNNPIRLFLGWFAIFDSRVPPLSVISAYWMGGAFLMAAKRLVEIEQLGSVARAGQYRKSLAYYTKENIILQMFFYATMTAFLLGVFIARYRVELVIIIPLLAASFTRYVKAAISPAIPGEPESLYKEKALAVLLGFSLFLGVTLLFVKLDFMRRMLNIQEPALPSLWPTS
ncbi:UbiA family prenyltransferase [Thermogutta sp.]|uniref:UbiA family prenyltransferase n=2 Tax=Thermogutta sp. TaxID=1962930 RepID=UPI003C7B7475